MGERQRRRQRVGAMTSHSRPSIRQRFRAPLQLQHSARISAASDP